MPHPCLVNLSKILTAAILIAGGILLIHRAVYGDRTFQTTVTTSP